MNRSPMTWALLLTLSSACALLCDGAVAGAERLEGKADSFLVQRSANASTQGRANVIVRANAELTAAQENQLKLLSADIYRRLPIIRSVALSLPSRNLERLAALAFVQRLSADLEVKKNDEFTIEHSGCDTAVSQYNLTGRGVTVA